MARRTGIPAGAGAAGRHIRPFQAAPFQKRGSLSSALAISQINDALLLVEHAVSAGKILLEH